MVNGQLRTSDVTDTTLLAAFLAIAREDFVAPAFAGLAYLDQDIPAAGAESRKLIAPRTIGRLLQAAEIKPGERALEVGGGSGYGAALLAELGAEVTLLEFGLGRRSRRKEFVRRRRSGLGLERRVRQGRPAKGPFDVILINGAFQVLPAALVAQLADGGRLVGIDATDDSPRGVVIRKSGRGFSGRPLFDATADVLPGLVKVAAFAF